MFARSLVVIGLVALALCCASCGSYELCHSGADVTSRNVRAGDKIRVHLQSGLVTDDIVVRVSDEALVCRSSEYEWNDIAAVERWRGETWKTLWVVAGVGATLFVLLFASMVNSLANM